MLHRPVKKMQKAIREVITGHDALVLQRHGSLTVGSGPLNAYYRTETLEQIARITYMLHQVGGGQPLPAYQVEKLIETRRDLGLSRAADEAEFAKSAASVIWMNITLVQQKQSTNGLDNDLVHEITKRVMQEINAIRN